MNEELNRKLAEWRWGKHYEWYPPEESYVSDCPNFTESLDACFKWLVPKVIGTADYSIIITQNLGQCVGYVRPLQGGRLYDAVDNHSPALALCLAIEKLIDGEK